MFRRGAVPAGIADWLFMLQVAVARRHRGCAARMSRAPGLSGACSAAHHKYVLLDARIASERGGRGLSRACIPRRRGEPGLSRAGIAIPSR
eukprot:8111036-Alexandrium_andersonii.AAC.1